jgi:hypothetical protein
MSIRCAADAVRHGSKVQNELAKKVRSFDEAFALAVGAGGMAVSMGIRWPAERMQRS